MRILLLVLAASLLASCNDTTGPSTPVYSLAGHWYATGASTFDFVATDNQLSASAAADSASRGMTVEATASGGGYSLLRYRAGGLLYMRITTGPGAYSESSYATLPDTVRSFAAGGMTLTVK